MASFSEIKTRFCPSPTGLIHLGNARTALFNTLLALHYDGVFLLRIEDTDRERSTIAYDEAVQRDLHWLGLDWQEGPGSEGAVGPYRQSNRHAIYDDYYQRLITAGCTYSCFCSEQTLALTRKMQLSQGKAPRYPGTCQLLTEQEIEQKLAQGLKPTLRFRVPENEIIHFDDLVRGEQRFASNDIGDFIIRRADGSSPFMFCNAIDDTLMGVTHVLRGEDHLTNTPRQIMILQALGLTPPQYGHIALIVAADASPLSKRHGSRSIEQLRQQGYLPGAINNYLARLGHYYGHDHYLSLRELANQFNIASLAKSPAKFNTEQLMYWQKLALMQLDQQAFIAWLHQILDQDTLTAIPDQSLNDFIAIIRSNVTLVDDVNQWIDIIFSDDFAIDVAQWPVLMEVGSDYFKIAVDALDQFGPDFKAITQQLKQSLNINGKKLYMPLRLAMTGEEHGPELAKLITLIPRQELRRRLQQVML